jgi:DNA polymerase I
MVTPMTMELSGTGRFYLPGMQGCMRCTLGSDNPGRIHVVPGYGVWPNKVMLIAQSPGSQENYKAIPLVGVSGQLLAECLAEVGWNLDELFRTNVNLCHPPGDRKARKREVEGCYPWLEQYVRVVDPDLIIPLGDSAYRAFLPDEPSSITAIRGHHFEREILGRTRHIVPTIHPAFVTRNEPAYRPLFLRDLAFAKEGLESGKWPTPTPFTSEKSSWDELVEAAHDCEIMGLDLEYDGPIKGFRGVPVARYSDIVGIGISTSEGSTHYYPNADVQFFHDHMHELKDVFESETAVKVVSNVKAEKEVLHRYGIDLRNYRDTLIEAWLIGQLDLLGPMPLALKDAWQRLFGTEMIRIDTIIGKGVKDRKHQGSMLVATAEDEDSVVEYAAQDPDASLRLHKQFMEIIKQRRIEDLYLNVELPFTDIIIEMEEVGMGFDEEMLEDAEVALEQAIARMQAQLLQLAGVDFNPNSSQQTAKILYGEDFNSGIIPTPRWDPQTKKNPPTDKVTLAEHVGNPVVRAVLTARAVRKMLTTYVTKLPTHVEPDNRIHCDINQTGTSTGRVSSRFPNLTNIPARERDDVEVVVRPDQIRGAFVAEPGNFIFAPDLSQIEMRFAAHLSNDASMIDILHHHPDSIEGDIHSNSARGIYKTSEHALIAVYGEADGKKRWKNMRYLAKTIGFGTLYGLTAHGLLLRTPTLDLTIEEGTEFINEFYNTYPGLRTWQARVRQIVLRNGWYETILGRRRYFPEITARDRKLSMKARNECVNFPIQGGAADYFKLSIINVKRKLIELEAKTRLTNQVHDEIVMEGPKSELDMLATEIPPVMAGIADMLRLRVPVFVDFEYGESWGSLQKIAAS